jgi:hypothetical protein
MISTSLACSISGITKQVQSVDQTAQALRSEVGSIVTAGSSLVNTAQALETQHPGVLETAKAIATHAVPVVSTIQAVATNNPGLVQTAQALIEQELPSGEPPEDIPIYSREQAQNFFGSSQYIFYTTQTEYTEILNFYVTQMPAYGWLYLEDASHEYANAAQLNYSKGDRVSTINLSVNPLNNTTVVVINTGTQ